MQYWFPIFLWHRDLPNTFSDASITTFDHAYYSKIIKIYISDDKNATNYIKCRKNVDS